MRPNVFTLAAGGFVSVLGVGALIGWLIGNEHLTRFVPGFNSMSANTAFCLVLLGAALLIGARLRAFELIAAVVVLATGLATLLEHALDLDLRIDELLVAQAGAGDGGRVGANTAAALVLVAAALILLRRQTRKRVLAAQTAALTTIAIALFAGMGYASGVEALTGLASQTPMALGSALALLLLSLAVLASTPEHGLSATILARTPGGHVARRLLPIALFVPLGLGVLRVVTERFDLVARDVGVWATVATMIALFATAIVFVVRSADAADAAGVVRGELESSEAMLAQIVQSSRDAIVTIGIDRCVTTWNHGAERLYGWSPAEILGRPIDRILPLDVADDFDRFLARVEAGEELMDVETAHVSRDGAHVELSLSVWPLRDSDGVVTHLATIARDIGERRRAHRELEAMAAKLASSNAELEQFASIASHDLREPLRKIQSFAKLLERRFSADLPEEAQQHLGRMSSAAARMETLIDGVLELARATRSEGALEPISLTEIAHDVVDDLVSRIEETGAVVEVGDLAELEADAVQIRQLLQNLIANALKFRRAGVAPRVTVTTTVTDSFCDLVVADNGIGFDSRHVERIFGPFQRLHGRDEFEGSGIGLALCRRIAERHGGSIAAHSEPGAGSTFVVSLPMVQHPAEVAA